LNRASASAIAAFPLNLALAVAAALMSYYVIEQPVLRLRRRLETRWRRLVSAPAMSLERRQLNEEHVLPEGAL
jgi:peptidoglycan/LPS O-acetylase OafA/YrhL